jgi:hypothetical protein
MHDMPRRMPRRTPPELLLVGPAHHGVVAYARDLAQAVNSRETPAPAREFVDAETAIRALPSTGRVHVHVTDRILGSSPENAAALIEEIAANSQLSVTLHDVPQASDGVNFARRAAAYRRILRTAHGAVVNSEYEARLVAENLGHPAEALAVIPIGARTRSVPPGTAPPGTIRSAQDAAAIPLNVLIAGFIYPGKGHLEAIEALATVRNRLRTTGITPPETAVIAIGSPSAGHEGDVDALRCHAADRGIEFRVTGYLNDEAYRVATASPGIPVAGHRHISASRSMLDWIEQGRMPLVSDSRYAREMAALRPGTITLFRPDTLADSLEHAWRHPETTRLPPGTNLGPTIADGADAYRAWWDGLP